MVLVFPQLAVIQKLIKRIYPPKAPFKIYLSITDLLSEDKLNKREPSLYGDRMLHAPWDTSLPNLTEESVQALRYPHACREGR